VEGFQQDKLKYCVVFVSRILKEAVNQKSVIFKASNPWVSSLLSVLKDIKENLGLNPQQNAEINNEVDGVFKAFTIVNPASEI